jgi:hypothetical protein
VSIGGGGAGVTAQGGGAQGAGGAGAQGAGGAGAQGAGGSGGGLVCTPGTAQPCYTGPSGTQGVGLCQAGTQTCLEDGSAQASGAVWAR